MAALSLVSVCILCAAQTAAPTPQVMRWHDIMAQASSRFAVPESWIARVMQIESGGRTVRKGGPMTSRAGAMGLMQLMPDTYADMRRQYGLGPDPFEPRDNILAGTAFLRAMYVRYGYPNLFAAYHAGPGRLDEFLWGRRPLPAATLAYIDHVISNRSAGANISLVHNKPVAEDGLFVVNSAIQASRELSIGRYPHGNGLFVQLSSDASSRLQGRGDAEWP